MPDYLTVAQVAEKVGCSYEHVRLACVHYDNTGEGLEAYRPGKSWRIPTTAPDRWVRGEPPARRRLLRAAS